MVGELEKKKGYKKTKLGWIPEDWNIIKFKDVGTSIIGLTYSPQDIASSGVLVLRSSNIKHQKIVYNDNVYVRKEVPSKLITKQNDILMCVRNGSKNLVGKSALIKKYDEGHSFGAFMSILRSDYNEFLYQYLQSPFAQKQYIVATSATINQITSKDLDSLTIISPPQPEQKKIAEILSTWDDGIEILEKLIEQKEFQHKALTQKLLKGEIRLTGFSNHWAHIRFNNIFARVSRKNEDLNSNILTISAQHGLINQADFYYKRIASVDTSKYILLKNGEFAYNKSYSTGYPLGAIKRLDLYNEGVVSSLYICFRLKNADENSDFWRYYFEAGMLNKEIKMIAQEGARNHGLLNMSTEDFFNMFLFAPSVNEQQRISEVLKTSEKELKCLTARLEKLKEQKKGLMQKLLTGQIRVKV